MYLYAQTNLQLYRQLAADGYAMPLYPLPVVLMLLYVLCGIASGFAGDFVASAGGLVIIASGAVVYQLSRRNRASV